MVRDAYSAGGQQALAADDTPDQSHDIRLNASNLTQELAQLLAASIAQGQASRRVGNPTGAELASLAALVSSAQNQRGLTTGFKDGLSSLSYTPPPQQSYVPPPQQSYAPIQQAPVSVGAVQLTEQHDDEPMPIPSTWRQPTVSDDDRWYRQQLGAAALGLAAGLMVVVPAVLWLSGWLGGPTRSAATGPGRQTVASVNLPETIRAPDIKTVKVRPADRAEVASQYVAATIEPRMPAAETAPPVAVAPAPSAPPVAVQLPPPPAAVVASLPPVVVAPPPPRAEPPPRSRVEELLAHVERLIEGGDILGARGVLAGNEGVASGPAAGALVFALAETYDPNMLAAWGTRGITADVMKAKSLYGRARELGIARAQMRLDQLK